MHNELPLSAWVYGFLRQLKDPRWEADKVYMERYFIKFMEDVMVNEDDWVSFRETHAAILTHMENRVFKWSNSSQINKMRTRFVYSVQPVIRGINSLPQTVAASLDKTLIPCAAYNRGACPREGSHSGLTHMCAVCWRDKRKVFRHPESKCYQVTGQRANNQF